MCASATAMAGAADPEEAEIIEAALGTSKRRIVVAVELTRASPCISTAPGL
jgi:hypothetical protein